MQCGAIGIGFVLEKQYYADQRGLHELTRKQRRKKLKTRKKKINGRLRLKAKRKDGVIVDMTVDHFIPRALGGTDHINNLQPMCKICNTKKSNTSPHELLLGKKWWELSDLLDEQDKQDIIYLSEL